MMIPPSPELIRRFQNTDEVVRSGKSDMLPNLIANFPNDYMDLASYESMKRVMQL